MEICSNQQAISHYFLKKIEDDVSSLKDQCHKLLAAKQDLTDKARTILVGNRSMVQRLQATGIPVTTESDDHAYESFNQVIDNWTTHVTSRPEDEMEAPSNDIDQLLSQQLSKETKSLIFL